MAYPVTAGGSGKVSFEIGPRIAGPFRFYIVRYTFRIMKKYLFIVLIVGTLAAGLYLYQGDGKDATTDDQPDSMTHEESDAPAEETDVESADLNAVGDYSGSGTATRQYEGSTFTHTVTANIGAPAEGKFYEGWLVRKIPFSIVSTGKLEKNSNGYALSFTSADDLNSHSGIVVTEETESMGLDGKPEAHVLEGGF